MNLEGKRGIVFGLFVLAAVVVTLSLVSAGIVTESFNFTSSGCDAGHFRFVEKVISITPGTNVNVSVPVILMTDGVTAYSGLKTDDFLMANGNNINLGLVCTTPPWTKNTASQCYMSVDASSVNFSGIDNSFGGSPGNRCFSATKMVSNGSVIYTSTSAGCSAEGSYIRAGTSCCSGLNEFQTNNGKLCYDASKGEPRCRSVGTRSEGWYYPDGKLLKWEFCSTPVQECVNLTTTIKSGAGACHTSDVTVKNGTLIEAHHSDIYCCYSKGGTCYSYCNKCRANAYINFSAGYEYNKTISIGGGDCSVTVDPLNTTYAALLNTTYAALYCGRLDDKDTHAIVTQWCQCTPKCSGKTCGSDGCGGSCGTCGSGDFDTIMRLSANESALGGRYDSSYPILINYTKIFGERYVGTNPHACDGTNFIMSLTEQGLARTSPAVNVCIPKTCAQIGKSCGVWYDGCNGTIDCTSCDSGEFCNGTSGACQVRTGIAPNCPSFTPPLCVGGKTVANGVNSDGCTNPLKCVQGEFCIPKTCAQIGKSCGSWNDGCGAPLQCESCDSGEFCNGTSGACQVRTGIAPNCPSFTPPLCVGGKTVANGVNSDGCTNPMMCAKIYNVSICYGNVSCTAKTACSADETEILGMSAESDALLALPRIAGYPYKICCKQAGVLPDDYYWAGASSLNKITSAIEGQTVRLVAKVGAPGSVVNFTIYQRRALQTDASVRTNVQATAGTDGAAIYSWMITRDDLNQGWVGTLLNSKVGDYYFVARNSTNGRAFGQSDADLAIYLKQNVTECNVVFKDSQNVPRLITYCDNYNFIRSANGNIASNATRASQCNADCNLAALNDKEVLRPTLPTGWTSEHDQCLWNGTVCVYNYDLAQCNCNSKYCGDDGCGRSCGTCPAGSTCNSAQQCIPNGGGGGGGGGVLGQCNKVVVESKACDENLGYRTVTYDFMQKFGTFGANYYNKAYWDANLHGYQWLCGIGPVTETIPCETSVQATLPFFGMMNLVSAMTIIALVYVLFLFKREFN